jgi:hypothetical protein
MEMTFVSFVAGMSLGISSVCAAILVTGIATFKR